MKDKFRKMLSEGSREDTLIDMMETLAQMQLECKFLYEKIEESLEDETILEYDELTLPSEFTEALERYDLLLEELY
jgi:hypothetical protein